MTTKTYRLHSGSMDRSWHVLDAKGRPLGRLASEAAQLLMGKHKRPDWRATNVTAKFRKGTIDVSGYEESLLNSGVIEPGDDEIGRRSTRKPADRNRQVAGAQAAGTLGARQGDAQQY